jgi:lysophospholipase L1-like esterase
MLDDARIPVTVRAGIPRVAKRLAERKPVSIVAFGTSMTQLQAYSGGLEAALRAGLGHPTLRFAERGLRGFVSWNAAFRVRDLVLPDEPDLVLLEFTHNEGAPGAIGMIEPALAGIMAQILARRPACEFVFVYLTPQADGANGVADAIAVWERIAGATGIPSIDISPFVADAIAAGRTRWSGGRDALTDDGIHYSAFGRRLVGAAFARTLLDLVAASRSLPERPPFEPPASPYARTDLRAAAHVHAGGELELLRPDDHEVRSADAYRERAGVPAPTARLQIDYEGTACFVWIRGQGDMAVTRADASGGGLQFQLQLAKPQWYWLALAPLDLAAERHRLTLDVGPGLTLGDVNVIGTFLPPDDGPGRG